jgi:hypothetical protein
MATRGCVERSCGRRSKGSSWTTAQSDTTTASANLLGCWRQLSRAHARLTHAPHPSHLARQRRRSIPHQSTPTDSRTPSD